jgi:hypothetical protein
MKKQKRH